MDIVLGVLVTVNRNLSKMILFVGLWMLRAKGCKFEAKADGASDVSVRQVVTLKAHPKNSD